MQEQEPQTIKAPRRRTRRERSERFIHFAPPHIEGQLWFTFVDEAEGEGLTFVDEVQGEGNECW